MLCNVRKWAFAHRQNLILATSLRCMTTTEVSTALRPFYFTVHPDLFGQYPNQRLTNENSLKQLSSFIESLQSRRVAAPCSLQFYIRDKSDRQNSFRLVKIYLNEKDVRATVLAVLKSCDLSTEYVDKIPKPPVPPAPKFTVKTGNSRMDENIDLSNLNENDPIFGAFVLKKKVKEARDAVTLKKWVEKNYKIAIELSKSHEPLRGEVEKLRKSISKQWGLKDLRWECGWNEQHFKGCLQSLNALAEQHPDPMHVLRGRILVFAAFTGISLDGHIMLSSSEVRHNWLDLIKNVGQYDLAFHRIPAFEKTVSQVLLNIKVVRRKFMPKILAGEYEQNLQQLTTSLNDYLSRKSYPKHWPESLQTFEIVVETEAGPLMVSPTGQFIVPSSCPGILLVKFISENMDEAKKRMIDYKSNKYIERSLHKDCIEELQLLALHKDDNITPELMIPCCEKLIVEKKNLEHLKGIYLNIATYYSVMGDGTMCIPWNFNI